jgi:phosphoglycerol transferase MdoB-like AlkP superfamily enzyme
MFDREIYSCALREMRTWENRRFVVLISTMDTHYPYASDGISEKDKKRFPTPFLRALHMADRRLGEFLTEFMADEKLYNDRTLIVVTADHTATQGENHLKRDGFFPGRIPLVFITPNKKAFEKLDTGKYASSIDLTPTLVHFIGGSIPKSFMGRDLFSRKNLAISWMIGDILLLRSPKRDTRFPVTVKNPDHEQKAMIDFFRSHY